MKIGIDVGSTAVKVVFVKNGTMVWNKAVPTQPGQQMIVDRLIEEGLHALSIERNNIGKICATGYGRKLIKNVDLIIDEITANAQGAFKLNGENAGTIVNIGGQDVKIIKFDEKGKVVDFKMNDKCAAGTGRFFEMAAVILDTPLNEFGDIDAQTTRSVSINSTCAVFAESEIVSLLAEGVNKSSIVRGLNEAISRRVANLAGNMDIGEVVYLDGGPALNNGLLRSLEEVFFCDILRFPNPQFTVGYGCTI